MLPLHPASGPVAVAGPAREPAVSVLVCQRGPFPAKLTAWERSASVGVRVRAGVNVSGRAGATVSGKTGVNVGGFT